MSLARCKKDHVDFLGTKVRTVAELKAAVIEHSKTGDPSFMCSSSIDWPEDYTSDPEIIYLCDLIRGNNVSGKNPEFNELDSLF